MSEKVACLFPAFAMRYKEFHRLGVAGYDQEVSRLLERASDVFPIDIAKFKEPDRILMADALQDDLQDHYVCYVDNCAVGKALRRQGIDCDYAAGYSMGLFSALYHGGAVSFEDGLRLMHHTCVFAHEALTDGDYGMGHEVGLKPDEVADLIAQHELNVELADICGPRVVIVAGLRAEVECLLDACIRAGSLNARLLPVSLPFHSTLLRPVERQLEQLLAQIVVRAPRCGIVSCLNQRVLSTADEVREELIRNVSHRMHWLGTMSRLLELDVNLFLECGFSDNLCNLATRNVKGKYRIFHCRQFDKLFAPAA